MLPTKLDKPVDITSDHVLGNPSADITLVEYGSYACTYCHAAHEVVADLRDQFGDRMRYVFRHRSLPGSEMAMRAAELAEYAAQHDKFWLVHDALMRRGPHFSASDFDEIAAEFELDAPAQWLEPERRIAEEHVAADMASARDSDVTMSPAFFINGRKYNGPWEKTALAEAMQGRLPHRLQTKAMDFVRWGPSAGFLLLFMTVAAVVWVNTPWGGAFEAWWTTQAGVELGSWRFSLPLLDWVNHGLLTFFFLVVGLEIKREFTVGRLASWRIGALPVAASFGGILAPALIYAAVVGWSSPLVMGWGVPIGTDTAFAVALIVLMGDRVPVELRVFLTAAVIVDDVVAIAVIALFYSGALDMNFLMAAGATTVLLITLNRLGVHNALPYALLGIALWVFLHDAGLHATLAGVILAVVTPTRPPANLRVLMAQAEAVIRAESYNEKEDVMHHGPSTPAMEALDTIYKRMESPADKLLRVVEPWSSYVVLPVFALANAGVMLSMDVFAGHERLMIAIILGLVVGKPLGIVGAAWLAVRCNLAKKPDEYSWRQLIGAGVLAGIGFTMSLFIAREAFADDADFAAAKIAIFLSSILAGMLGAAVLWRKRRVEA